MTQHCWKCGQVWSFARTPGRTETCGSCGSDLRVCLNCVSYDARVAHQCRDRRADPVPEKHLATFCEYFEFARREFKPAAGPDRREDAARTQLRRLLGD